MLKRLFIAVFVLGLVIGLNGTALSDVAKGSAALNSVEKVYPNNPRMADLSMAGPLHSIYKKPAGALEQNRVQSGLQMPSLKLDYFCDVQDYTNGALAYFWEIPDAYGDDLFNMRFTADANYDCTLKAAHLYMYALPQVGAPTMRVYLWDDDGFGFPGNKLDSVDILLPGDGLQGTNVAYVVSADFSAGNWVFSDGDEYHLGWTQLDQAGSVLAVLSDDATGTYAGEERSSEYYGGAWGTMLADWGADVSFFILAERCCSEIPFTDCYSQAYIQTVNYFWRAPHIVYGDEQYSEKFDVGGPETLVSVDIAIYGGGATSTNPPVVDPVGNNTIYIRVYDDDGGLPGTLLETVTLAPGTYSFYPALQNVPMPLGTVMENDFHVTFGSDGIAGFSWESCLSSNGADGDGRSASYFDTSGAGDYGWVPFIDGWGLDAQFFYVANMCKDEYSECTINYCYGGLNYFWRLPDVYGDFGQAQKFTGVGEECRVQDVALRFYWGLSEAALPLYTYSSDVKVWADAGGFPGTELASITLNPADYGAIVPTVGSTNWWKVVDFQPLNVVVTGSYWVGVIANAPTPNDGIRVLSDNGTLGTCDRSYAEYWGDWGMMTDDWGGLGSTVAMIIESEHCCIPYSERVCTTPGNWATYQGNYARTGASFVQMSDSWCDLTFSWKYVGATPVAFTGPVTYGDRVVCSFSNIYRVFNLNTGALVYSYNPQAGPFAAGDIRCAPTITMLAGYPDPVMFVAGGTNDEVHAVNFNTGVKIWSRDVLSVGPAGLFGDTRWGVFTVINIAGTDVVYWGTDIGRVVAANALTGALYPGWATNPVNLGQATWVSLATNGSALFIATQAAGVEGDVYSLDAATGGMNWQLSAEGGLQAATVFAGLNYPGDEGFSGGIAYDAQRGWIYFNSRCNGDFPADGVFYRVNAGSGALAGPASASNWVTYATPVVDAARVFVGCVSGWVSAPTGGNITAFNKTTGTIDWAAGNGPWPYLSGVAVLDWTYCSPVLSCEPIGIADQLYAFPAFGGYTVFNADNGDELYHRRASTGTNAIAARSFAGALTVNSLGESHLLYADNAGILYDFQKGVDRPRLEIQDFTVQAPVEFGAAPSLIVTIPNVFTNTGCTNLNFTAVTADEISINNQVIPDYTPRNVGDDMMDRMAKIADNLVEDNMLGKVYTAVDNSSDAIVSNFDENLERRTNYAAAGFPAWLNSVVSPAAGGFIAPGDTTDLVLDVIQSAINRGPQSFYLVLNTNDPDYFVNDGNKDPEMFVTIIGGCLIDTVRMSFGMGGANKRLVTNTSRLGTGDWTPHGLLIDGDGASYYQGSLGFWAGKYRIATHTQDWTSGGGENDAFVSMQPDPNWCDNDCKPDLQTNVTLGYMTSDGGNTYPAIMGEMVCASYLDSVQNFDPGTGWDWEAWGSPFDDTLTMGLYVNAKSFGALNVPALANVTVDVMEITERNGNSVDNWYLSHFYDCDNGTDTIQINRNYSVAWTLNGAATQAIGTIKIPFGCGYQPVRNIWGTYGVSGSHGFWGWAQYWDTAWWYNQTGLGAFTEATGMHGGDEQAHVTIDQHNFTPNEVYKVGVGHFLLKGLTNALDPNNASILALAKLTNQWCGFGRGDVNNDNIINLADIIYLAKTVNGGPGSIPFAHQSDVNADDAVDILDVDYLIDYYFDCGPCPMGEFLF